MYSQSEIEEAVAAGALAPEQAASFREFVAARNNMPAVDEEYFRWIRGYNDIFVAYACIAALVAAGMVGSLVPIGGRGGAGFGPFPSFPVFAPLLVAAASWGLAEIFTLRRRMALPSWLLTLTFGFGVFLTLLAIMQPLMGSLAGMAILAGFAAAIAAVATWAYWLRFRVPVAPAVAVGLGVLAASALLGVMFASMRGGGEMIGIVTLLIGIGVFAYAMWWDQHDRWRVTEATEVALWLHLLAAVLLVFPLAALLGVGQGIASIGSAVVMIVLFLGFALLSLLVNRKALVLTALAPLVQAVNSLVPGRDSGPGYAGGYGRSSPAQLFGGTVITVMIISLILLLLALFWSPIRHGALALLPAGLRERLAPTQATPFEQARRFE